MWFLILTIVAVLVLVTLVKIFFPEREYQTKYAYRKNEYLLTQPERDCFNALTRTVGANYYIFPQIHLASILDHKIRGQSWWGAFRHIDEKSVDFVLCDKERLSPILAIELDDRSHERPDRRVRDVEVERILKEARFPLLRLQHNFVETELSAKIANTLANTAMDHNI